MHYGTITCGNISLVMKIQEGKSGKSGKGKSRERGWDEQNMQKMRKI